MIGEWSILSENGTHKYEFAGTEWLNPQGDSVTPFVSERSEVQILLATGFKAFENVSWIS